MNCNLQSGIYALAKITQIYWSIYFYIVDTLTDISSESKIHLICKNFFWNKFTVA